MTRPQIEIYTDGACSPNPGLGGWGAILMRTDKPADPKELSGAERETTNNRMELLAAVKALEALLKPCDVTIYTDSSYLCDAFRKNWIDGWERRGWVTSSGSPVKNEDLWRRLIVLTNAHNVTWQWVKGHNENIHNERCDVLAVAARLKLAGEPSVAAI